MEYRQFAAWVMASWLCLVSTGLPHLKDLNRSEMANGLEFNNATGDLRFNETESITGDAVSDSIADKTTSHPMLEKMTKNLEQTTKVLEEISTKRDLIAKNLEVTAGKLKPRRGLVPLAVGGLALLSGLLFLAFIVGLFMYCNRNSGFVYERSTPEALIDV